MLGRLLPAPGRTTPAGWPGCCPPSARSLGVPAAAATGRPSCSSSAPVAQRGGGAGRRPGLRAAAPAQRPRAVPARLLPAARRLAAGFPSTTATSMGTFGTGLPPGAHGLVGYEVLVPGRGPAAQRAVLGERPRPAALAAAADRVRAGGRRRGGGHPDRSRLLRRVGADQRGPARRPVHRRRRPWTPGSTPPSRPSARGDRSLVYLYWGELDKVGHVHGCQSWEWGDELEPIDRAMRRLVAGRARGHRRATSPPTTAWSTSRTRLRIDLAHEPSWRPGCGTSAASPGALQLYCEARRRPRRPRHVAGAAGGARLGPDAGRRRSRRAGSARSPRTCCERIGDVIVPMRDNFAVVDSRTARPELLRARSACTGR